MSGQDQTADDDDDDDIERDEAPEDGGQERAGFGIEEQDGAVAIEVTGATVNIMEVGGKRKVRVMLPAIADATTLRDALETFLTYHQPKG